MKKYIQPQATIISLFPEENMLTVSPVETDPNKEANDDGTEAWSNKKQPGTGSGNSIWANMRDD